MKLNEIENGILFWCDSSEWIWVGIGPGGIRDTMNKVFLQRCEFVHVPVIPFDSGIRISYIAYDNNKESYWCEYSSGLSD